VDVHRDSERVMYGNLLFRCGYNFVPISADMRNNITKMHANECALWLCTQLSYLPHQNMLYCF